MNTTNLNTEAFEKPQQTEVVLLADSKTLVEQADQYEVDNEQKAADVIDIIKAIKAKFDATEEERDNLVRPFNTGVKNINSRFKLITQPLEAAEKTLRKKLSAYQVKLEDEQRKEAMKIQKVAEERALNNAAAAENEGDTVGAEAAMNVATQISNYKPQGIGKMQSSSGAGRSSIITKKSYIITDIKLLANSYPDLVEEKAKELRALINSGAVKSIPGVEITEEKNVRIS